MKNVFITLFVLTMIIIFPNVISAKSVECKVASVDGDTVVLECAEAGQVKAGDRVKIKTDKKRTPYGGC